MSSRRTISNSFVVNTVEDGTSPFVADFSNEMDSVQCSDAGVPLSTQTIKTEVRLYRGTTDIQPYVASVKRNGVVMTVSTAFEKWVDTGVEVTFSLNSTTHLYELAVKYTSSATISNKRDVFSARIIDNPSSETFEGDKDFVINAVSGDVYNLVPSLTQINVGIVNGSYSPANVSISCQYTKRDVGGNITTSTESQAQGLIGGVYRIFVRLHSRTSGWGNFIRYGDSELHTYLTQTGITISMYDSLEFYLCTNTEFEFSNPSDLRGCIDKESVPVVSDGEDGDDGESAAAAFATPNSISVPCNTDGTTTALLEKDVTFSLKVGSNSSVTVQNVTVVNKPTAVTVTGRTSNVVTISIPAGTASSTLLSGVTLSVLGYITGSPTPLYSAQVTVALVPAVKGATGGTGARGKIGRWFYFGGVWEDIASDASFLINDAQAPYFKHLVSGSTTQYDFHVFNPETNPQSGSMTKAQMWSASSSSWNNSPWEIMTDDQKYYIAKAMFAEYAQFGSFVINGDWLISTKGTKGNDSNSQDYQSFDPFFVESKYLCVNASVDKVDTTEIICSHEFEEDKEYSIHLKANNIVRGTSYAPTLYVFISNGNSRVSDIIQLTESTTEYTFTFTPTDTGTYNVVAYFYHVPATCYLTADVTNVFVPNYAVDGLTGNSYQQSAYIRGTLQSTLILSETERVTQNITIDPANNPARIFILPYSGSALTVTLPDPKDYVGLELKFYTPMYSGTTPPTHILSASRIEYSTFAIVGSSYVRRTTSGTNFNVPRAFPVTLKAIDNRTWLVLEDVARGITTSITINGKVMYFVNGLLVDESFNT